MNDRESIVAHLRKDAKHLRSAASELSDKDQYDGAGMCYVNASLLEGYANLFEAKKDLETTDE
jgi:hypothetical protein